MDCIYHRVFNIWNVPMIRAKGPFIKYEDFEDLGKLSSFVGSLKNKSLINIESILLIPGDRVTWTYRVWYYNI